MKHNLLGGVIKDLFFQYVAVKVEYTDGLVVLSFNLKQDVLKSLLFHDGGEVLK
jgi:hypothetical protein